MANFLWVRYRQRKINGLLPGHLRALGPGMFQSCRVQLRAQIRYIAVKLDSVYLEQESASGVELGGHRAKELCSLHRLSACQRNACERRKTCNDRPFIPEFEIHFQAFAIARIRLIRVAAMPSQLSQAAN